MVNVVFRDRGTLSPQTSMRAPGFAHQRVVHEQTRPEEVAGRVAKADIVICNEVRLSADLFVAADTLARAEPIGDFHVTGPSYTNFNVFRAILIA